MRLLMVLFTWFLPLAAAPIAHGAERPNVIVMVADDLGWADVGFHGGPIDTPSLDRLAAEGMQLDRFYTTPICSPTRAALMTGRDPLRLGVAYATILSWDNTGIHPDEHFMPQSFLDAGYQTAMIGKWHLGHAQQTYHPNERGFEHFYGHLHTQVGYYPPFSVQGGKDFQRNGQSIDDQGYETYLLADEASRWIQSRDKKKPFFLYMPFIAPHTPFDAPDDLKEKYAEMEDDREPSRSKSSDTTRWISRLMFRPSARPIFAAVVEGMDRAIGQVLDTLDAEGISDDTIVLFFSDNGGAVYAGGGADNAPLRGGKGDTFEGGIRVVSVMRWPDGIAAGKTLDQIMTVMDVFPTLAEAAGIETRNRRRLDGRSMWPAISEGTAVPLKDDIYFVSETPRYGSFSLTVFNQDWKLVQAVEQDQLSTTVTNYLFRIQDDPHEYRNLASDYPEVVAELSEKIRNRRALYPISGTRSQLVPPPGWRAPKDWATYPIPIADLQAEPAPGMVPEYGRKAMDLRHGERGRLLYDCTPKWWLAGWCLEND
jgi:arylsulfatase A-like enzyme